MIINRNIWTVEPYVYKATLSGVDVYDLSSNSLISSSAIAGGANYVWANDQHVYAATSGIGLCRSQSSLPLSFSTYKTYPEITSDIVNCVHGNGDYLCATTVSGVDRYNTLTDDRVYNNISNACKCFQVSNGDYYYTTNDFSPIMGLESSIFEWPRSRRYTLSSPIAVDGYQYYFEIPSTQTDNIYEQTTDGGSDIRVISDLGKVLPYYIEKWDNINDPGIYVKLPLYTNSFYVIWGNKNVSGVSDISKVFLLYDNFSGTTIDTNKWTINKSGSAAEADIVGGCARIKSYFTGTPTSLTSKTTFSGAVVDCSLKTLPYSVNSHDDMQLTISFVGGTSSSISDTATSSYGLHKIVPVPPQATVSGTKYLSSAFSSYVVKETAGLQSSVFDGETLTTSGAITLSNRAVRISHVGAWYSPYVYIDWVRIRHCASDAPVYYTGSSSVPTEDALDFGAVHSSYTSGGGFSYTAGLSNFINASYINDIFVTEGTSMYNGANVIFVATDHGATVLEENRGNEVALRKRIYLLET